MAFIIKNCLPVKSLIHTKKGLKKILDIQENDMVMTSIGYRNIKNIIFQGKQNLATIYTECGEFRCTPNHYMAVIDNITQYKWVEAQDLKEGDRLLTTRKPIEGITTYLPINEFNNSNSNIEITPDIGWFIGIFNEAGNYNTDYINDNTFICDMSSFNITIYGENVANSIKNIIKLLDNNAKCTIKRLYGENIYTIICNSENLTKYFNKNIKNNYNIPKFIRESTLDVRKAYIAGIIDGNVNKYDNGFIITNSNKERVDEIQNLCYSCGFETANIFTHKKNTNMSNILKVTTHFTANILNSIKQLHVIINKDDIYDCKNSYPVNMVKNFIEDEYKDDNIITNKCIYDLFNKLNIDNVKNITINDFDHYVLTLNYCPVSITKVVFDNYIVEDTYNIEIEDKHEFYCNGYLNKSI